MAKSKNHIDVCPDYEDLFKTFNTHGIKYLLVGGQAVIFYTEPRYTKDIDVWVISELNDSEVIYKALKDFGAPLRGIIPADFDNPNLIFQMGVAPVRIDVMMNIEGVDFARAWRKRKRAYYGGTAINVMSREDLLEVKRKAGRPQDLLDADKLRLAGRKPKKRSL